MCFIKSLKFCKCPTPMEDYTINPIRKSPMDTFGYKAKCCGCIPLKAAVIVIGIITLIWSVIQINSAEKTMSDIIPDKKSSLFYYGKLLYMFASMVLMVSCGVLFIGIVMMFNLKKKGLKLKKKQRGLKLNICEQIEIIRTTKNKFHIINMFVWYGFIFDCISIILTMTSFVLKILRTEGKILKYVIRVILAMSWNFLFLYFLVIVNSYKMIMMWT